MKIKIPYCKEFEWTRNDTFAFAMYLLGVVVGTIWGRS